MATTILNFDQQNHLLPKNLGLHLYINTLVSQRFFDLEIPEIPTQVWSTLHANFAPYVMVEFYHQATTHNFNDTHELTRSNIERF